MQKLILISMLFFATMASSFGQKTNQIYLELGGARGSFQDLKYSQARYAGLGGQFSLGYDSKSTKTIWGYSLNVTATSETTKLHNNGKTLAISPIVQVKYLKGLSDKLYIGAKWDILSGNYRSVDGLGNNGNYVIASSNLFAAGVYKHDKFEFGLDLALLSLVKENTGFAFSAPQKVLEDGAFNYQNESLPNPLPVSFGQVRGPIRHFVIRTNIAYRLSNQFTVSYNWTMKKYNEVEDFGTALGISSVSFRWNIKYKQKEIAQN